VPRSLLNSEGATATAQTFAVIDIPLTRHQNTRAWTMNPQGNVSGRHLRPVASPSASALALSERTDARLPRHQGTVASDTAGNCLKNLGCQHGIRLAWAPQPHS
jgi:hypothetical protein